MEQSGAVRSRSRGEQSGAVGISREQWGPRSTRKGLKKTRPPTERRGRTPLWFLLLGTLLSGFLAKI